MGVCGRGFEDVTIHMSHSEVPERTTVPLLTTMKKVIQQFVIMSPDPELSLQKGAYTIEDLFCGTGFPQR